MRKIKFRAWEKTLKEMIPIYRIDFEKKMINMESAWRLFDEVELMQFTGLKDKNGKEIYESDVLRGFDKDVYVKWDEEWACWAVTTKTGHGLGSCPSKEMEVIGNIYDNPELLEVTS